MNTIDTAFVRAFARKQTAEVNQDTAKVEFRVSRHPIRVDESVAKTAAMWIDQDEGRVIRGDASQPGPPPSHLRSSESLPPTDVSSKQADSTKDIQTKVRLESLQQDQEQYVIASFTAGVVQESIIGGSQKQVAGTEEATSREETPDVSHSDSVLIQVDDVTESSPNEAPFEQIASRSGSKDERVHDLESSSTKTLETLASIDPFEPAWAVDSLVAAPAVADLFFDDVKYAQIGRRIAQVVEDGMRVAQITSVRGGEGRTTIAIGLAMTAAGHGLKVLLIDADIKNPGLASALRLDVESDWIDAVAGPRPLDDVAVMSEQDGIAVLPICDVSEAPMETPDLQVVVNQIKDQFDLILIDCGPNEDAIAMAGNAFDASLVVRDVRNTAASEVNDLARELTRVGVGTVGVIENFA